MSNLNHCIRKSKEGEINPGPEFSLLHDNTNKLDEQENNVSEQNIICFICQEKKLPDPDCKVCHNIALYHSKYEQHANGLNDNDEKANVFFPGPGIVRNNHIYGNYVVASRTIKPGELIILERPLTIGPYSPPEILPLCLSCFADIGVSSKCSRCRWPVCGKECEKFYLHAENECEIFAKCGIKSKGELNEYFSVETLRALLLRMKNPEGWKRVLEFEPHVNARSNDYRAKAVTDFIISFVRDKCKLANEFSADVIDHVVGVLSINTFWAFKDLNRYASCLFDKITLLAHDCDPNTERKLVLMEGDSDRFCENDKQSRPTNDISTIALHITASREIACGEMITTRYIDINQSLDKRRQELKETFYFDCTCSRCLQELKQVSNQNFIEQELLATSLG